MSLPWELAPRLIAQFAVRSSWPAQLRLLHCEYPGVLGGIQLRFDYEAHTESSCKRIMLARLTSLLRAFKHVGALLDDIPPAESVALAEHLVACVTDGASSTISVGSFTALGAYLATRRAEVDRLCAASVRTYAHMNPTDYRQHLQDAIAAPITSRLASTLASRITLDHGAAARAVRVEFGDDDAAADATVTADTPPSTSPAHAETRVRRSASAPARAACQSVALSHPQMRAARSATLDKKQETAKNEMFYFVLSRKSS